MKIFRHASRRMNARGYRGRPERGRMNKTEEAYADQLQLRQHAGEVLWFGFEVLKLRLADNTFYEPDFLVELEDGLLEVHEVKGFWDEDARIKIKCAAALYPFRFVGVTHRRGEGWAFESFPGWGMM